MSTDTSHSNNQTIQELLNGFSSASARQKRALANSIEQRAGEIADLGPAALAPFDPEGDDWAAGWILQVLNRYQPDLLCKGLLKDASGWLSAPSLVGIDYGPLQNYLLSEEFEEADRFTSSALRELAGPGAQSRGYVYFTEVESMSGTDLVNIDRLWNVYSQGKFGFSVQARLLSALEGRYERLWPRIGWKLNGTWTRYPSAFEWSLNAPEGHMPLINQLRGVRLMDALLSHPSLNERK